ncbi:Peroxin-3 [Neoconidiobolus thromboides FSU 785]|nr:Peroxin-3 [Neoconidiobolus thromboides FSU 785]
MLQKVVDYYNRYKRPILIISGVVSFAYFASSYTKDKITQFQMDQVKSRKAKENLKKRFEKNLIDTNEVIKSLLGLLKTNLFKDYPVEDLVQQITELKNTTTDKTELKQLKLKLWEQVKIMSFTRTLGSLYLINFLSLLTYIQMNLVGRLIYIESIIGAHPNLEALNRDSTSTPAKMSYENEKLFLSFTWWFINRGYQSVMETIHNVVKNEMESIALSKKFNYTELLELTMKLRLNIDDALFMSNDSILNAMLPYNYESEFEVLQANGHSLPITMGTNEQNIKQYIDTVVDHDLRSLLNETKDFIESNDFKLVFNKILDLFMEPLLIELKQTLFESKDSESTPRAINLARIIPTLSSIPEEVFNTNDNKYIDTASECSELHAFAAVIYSSFEFLS